MSNPKRSLRMDQFMNVRARMPFLTFLAQLILLLGFISGAEPKFIFITGGSASGKTTFARLLVKELGDDQAFYLSLDDYLDKRVQPESDFVQGIPNFDNPSMINWQLFLEHLAHLQKGLSIASPVYDFSTWGPVGTRQTAWRPVVIVEGIHATQDPIDSVEGLRIFIDVSEALRYQRRIIRDIKERNYSLDLIKEIFFKMAVPYQKIFLDPTRDKANIIIEDLDGKDYLKKAVEYVVQVLKFFEPTLDKSLQLKVSYQQEDLVTMPQN